MTDPVLDSPLVQSIGWALVNSIWQGTLIGAGTALALRALSGARANTRYLVACVGLLLMLLVPLSSVLSSRAQDSLDVVAMASSSRDFVTIAPMDRILPLAVVVWVVGVALLSIRLVAACLGIERMKRAHTRGGRETVPAASGDRSSSWRRAVSADLRVQRRSRADCRRISPTHDPAAGECHLRVACRASGCRAGSRAGAREAPRLSRQRAAVDCRDAPLLSPGRLVVFATGPHGAGTLLRRPGCRGVRRSRGLRDGPRSTRRTERSEANAVDECHRRAADRSRPPRVETIAHERWSNDDVDDGPCTHTDCRRCRPDPRAHDCRGRERCDGASDRSVSPRAAAGAASSASSAAVASTGAACLAG